MWIENRSKGRSIAGSIPIVVVVKVKEHKIAILEPRELFPFQRIHVCVYTKVLSKVLHDRIFRQKKLTH